ncbi:MAG TPA: 6-carboxytetrahydropterin synthase [Bryobacteraceae bacterium]|jgi:6-pyruvoyltetrahydropterin/6-carboxytetrahydropterin synthase|nr:6-carboxytetrahydropterin synthase [Bryobacteraceae bacterium]
MTRVTRRYKFAASHRLNSSRLSEQQNGELYGKCNNPYGHGHDYVLEVSVAGPLDAVSGQVVNVQALDRLVHEQILRDFDHRYFNADVREFLGDLVPTSENILRVIENRLSTHWRGVFPGDWPHLKSIRLQETKRNRFELRTN